MKDRVQTGSAKSGAVNDSQTWPEVEKVLSAAFRPISPRSDFILTLKSRLNDPGSLAPYRKLSSGEIGLLFFSTATLVMIAVASIRLLIGLFSRNRRQSQQIS